MTRLSEGVEAIFESSRGDFEARVVTLEAAVAALLAGDLGEAKRAEAAGEAHKLTGALGSFGRGRGSDLARELETRFASDGPLVDVDGRHLLGVVGALRDELQSRPNVDRPSAGAAAQSSARVLVVDDDLAVRRMLASVLSGAGYDVHHVGSAHEARHALAHEKVDLLLSDVNMPGETGVDLIRFALCEHPGTATLLISAFDDLAIAQVAIDFGAYGYLSKPIRRTEVLVGAMNALRRRDVEAREHARLESALERVDVAATQFRALEGAAVHRWAQSSERRDPGIARHVERVSASCASLARTFGLHPESVGLAAALHDVGKVAIPDSILHKDGPLTAHERLVMETHADAGHEMLRGSGSRLLDLAAVIARSHHEKFDGSGYPQGLAGADIPLEGRITAVADVFDALTSDRVYRPAWSVDSASTWMSAQRGSHFDPEVLDAFLHRQPAHRGPGRGLDDLHDGGDRGLRATAPPPRPSST